MKIESSAIAFQSQQVRDEKTVNSSRLSVGAAALDSYSLEYQSRETEELSLYSEVREGAALIQFDQQRLAQELVSLELSSSSGSRTSLAGVDARSREDGSATVSFSQYRYTSSSESSLIMSSGSIELEDGRTIDFSMYFNRTRESELEVEQSFQIESRKMTDPLVLNFATDSLALESGSFFFDLNGDGQTEELSQLGAGSGFLVLDRNANGIVDDGSELFGPRTGQGFAELAQYDDDGNLWIDANDPVFSQLSVWVGAGSGSSELVSLADAGIGAIYLGSAHDRFELVDDQGRLLGQTKAAGIMVMESGEVRTVQELDLADKRSTSTVAENTELNPDTAEVREASNFADVLQRLNELRERQTRQLDALAAVRGSGNPAGNAPVRIQSPLEVLLEKLEKLREQLMKDLKIQQDRELKKSGVVGFQRDELTYRLATARTDLK